jgi:general secretion pathway protein L
MEISPEGVSSGGISSGELSPEGNLSVTWALIDPFYKGANTKTPSDHDIGTCLDTGNSSLSSLIDAYAHREDCDIYLVLSGLNALYRTVDIPAKTEAQTRAAIPYILEDELASPPEALHFAMGPNIRDNIRPALIIARDILDEWLLPFSAAGVNPKGVYIDADCMGTSDTATIHETIDGHFITAIPDSFSDDFLGGFKGTLDKSLCDTVGPHIFRDYHSKLEVHSDSPLTWIGDTDANAHNTGMHIAEVNYRPRLSPQDLLTRFNNSIINGSSINLLQGDYMNRRSFREIWLVWKRPFILSLALMFAFIGFFAVETWQLSRNIDRIDRDTQNAMAREFPGVRSINQVRARVRASQVSATDRFILLSEILFNSVQENENISVISSRYDESRGELAVSLNTGSFSDVELIKAAIERRGAGLSEGSSRQVDGRIIADIIVRERAS